MSFRWKAKGTPNVQQPTSNFHGSGRATVFALFLLVIFIVRSSFANDIATQFDAANKLYAQNKFAEAAATYEAIMTNGVRSPVLYFNLGNAYFKAGQIGRAIAAYRQAEQMSPRDPDLRANLSFAQKRVAGPTIKSAAWQRALGTLSLGEWTWLAVIGIWLTFGLLVARQIKPHRAGLKSWTWLSAAVTLVLFMLLGLAWTQSRPGHTAIVTATEATVRNSPLDEAPSAFTVNDGAELRVLDHKDDWLQVADDARRFGWVKRSSVSWSPRS
jgi:tetratricopeptide (TPR) repeat protein